MGLKTYQEMRDFRRTPEPRGKVSRAGKRRFVVQEHHASKLHFDFRLEMGGVLKSWSAPKGPSLDPGERRLALPTEDHPVEYLQFEGRIPEGNYGAGDHMIWDEGTYKLLDKGDPLEQLAGGKLRFELRGKKLRGAFTLLQMKGRDQWLLIKNNDEHAEPGWELRLRQPVDGQETIPASGKKRKKKAQPAAKRFVSSSEAGVKKFDTKKMAEGQTVNPAARAFKEKDLSGDLYVRAGRDVVPLTHLDKIYWPDEGYTKGNLIGYYNEVTEYILPHLKGRPLIMKRYPNGIGGKSFHQHDVNEVPDFVRTVTLKVEGGKHTVDYIVGDNRATLLYMANLGAIERHPWHSRVEQLDNPDWFVFDLDPGESVEFATICDVALATRDVLSRLELEGYPKTSGSRGLHIYVPIRASYSYEQVAELAEQIATVIAKENPEVATIERSLKKRRQGQIYVDHMQNALGKSVVAPYSVRPRPGATVAAPLDWKEVAGRRVTPQDFTIKNMLRRLEKKGDLFQAALKKKQSLAAAFEKMKELRDEAKRERKRARA